MAPERPPVPPVPPTPPAPPGRPTRAESTAPTDSLTWGPEGPGEAPPAIRARAVHEVRERRELKPVPLERPLKLTRLQHDERFMLVASSERQGLMQALDGGLRPKPKTRMVLVEDAPDAPPVRYVVEVRDPDKGDPPDAVRVSWTLISAYRRRHYLADALRRILRLRVVTASARDELRPGRLVVYDPRTRRIRSIKLRDGDTEDAVPEFGGELDGIQLLQRDLMKPPENAAGEPGNPMQWLMFQRATAPGEYELRGASKPMNCSWVGFSRCRFEIEGLEGPANGSPIRVGVPTEPLLRGLVWMDGSVRLASYDPSEDRTVVEVEWRDGPHQLPSSYRGLVAYCRMATLRKLSGIGA